ncbi:MAG TPA: carbohydrate binding domain-containing protein [Pyrinomonadaceae bacterium]|nr:carbohydrate binding domain-containing protein [Pyrinomonadaceae bacterium]
MPDALVALETKTTAVRFILAAVVFCVSTFAWFAVRWQLGEMIAEQTAVSDPNATELASVAVSLSPNNSLALWFRAGVENHLFSPENIESSVNLYQNVVRHAPFDFRWWGELGRAYEQAGNSQAAELAFKRAVDLAPAYVYPRWQLGNFLLRQGRKDEAFAELEKAADKPSIYRMPVYALAWEYFDHDPARLENAMPGSADARAELAYFYSGRARQDDAVRMWNSLSDDEKKANSIWAKNIGAVLFDNKYFRGAVEFTRQSGAEPDAQVEAVTNGGFESPTDFAEQPRFSWRRGDSDAKSATVTDGSIKHTGSRSLRTTFKGFSSPEYNGISQFVAVVPGGRYNLRFWVRTEELRSAGPPLVAIVNARNGITLATSTPFPTGSNEWREVEVTFTTPSDSDAIQIRLARSFCGDNCPIAGTVWLDDFELKRN